MIKTCTVCKQDLPFTSFHNSSLSKDGKAYRCSPCDKIARQDYRDKNRQRFSEISRNKQLKFKYGLTQVDYNRMLQEQNNSCAICKCSITSHKTKKSFCVDHNHTTGKVRGLLCNQCNRALGMFDDSTEVLQEALNYLKRDTH